MTTILSDYNKSILIELLNTNRQIIVVHGDDIDDYYTDSCYDIIWHCCKQSVVINLSSPFADGAAHEPIQRPAFSA